MRILVTGGAGFVGSHVVDDLVAAGHDVVVVDALHPAAHHRARPHFLNPAAEYHWFELGDTDALTPVLRGVQAVSHQAAMVGLGVDFGDVVDYAVANDLGTASLLRALHAARFSGRLVLASSMVVYGEGSYLCGTHGRVTPPARAHERLARGKWEPVCESCGDEIVPERVLESMPTDPRSVYAATKLHQEHLCTLFGRDHEVPVILLRYHNVYGPRMPRDTPYAGVASIFRSAIESGRAPEVFEDGAQQRDFVHVSDVARANRLALECDEKWSGPLNIASGEVRTVLDIACALADAVPGARSPVVVPHWRAGDVRHVVGAPGAAVARIGFRAEVPFHAGMADFASAPMRG